MMVASTLLIATSFPVVASIAGELESVVLTLVRFALAALVFLPLVALRHRAQLVPSGSSLLRYAALSAPLVGFFVAMFEALRTTTAANTGALFTFGPSFAALFALLLLGQRLSRARRIALLCGMVGALWVVFRGAPARLLELDLAVGDGIFLAGTACLGLYTVLIKRLHRGEPMAVMTFWTLLTGSGWLLLVGGRSAAGVAWGEVPSKVFLAISYLAIFTTLVTFLLAQLAVAVIGPTRTMAYTYLNPALVALLAALLGDELIGWRSLPGVGLTLLSLLVLLRAQPAPTPPLPGCGRGKAPPLLRR